MDVLRGQTTVPAFLAFPGMLEKLDSTLSY